MSAQVNPVINLELTGAQLGQIEEEDSDDSYFDMNQVRDYAETSAAHNSLSCQPNYTPSCVAAMKKPPHSPMAKKRSKATNQVYDSLAPMSLSSHRVKALPQDHLSSTQPIPYSVFDGSNSSSQFYEELPDMGTPNMYQEKSPPPPPKRAAPLSPPAKYNGLRTISPSASMPAMSSNAKALAWNPKSLLQESLRSEVSMAPSEEFIPSSHEMSLGELVEKHKDEFPVRVRVSRGFYGTSDKWSISEGEHFNIHFAKYTKVIGAVDSSFGNYTIPLNSSVEFGVLYNPHNSIDAAIDGYKFKTVAELTAIDKLPYAVQATTLWNKTKSREGAVQKGDVLIIRGTKGKSKKSLKCIHAITGEHKLLPPSCVGHFTTKPYEVRLFLPEIIKHFEFPQLFMMFIMSESNADLRDETFSHCVKLSHCSIETSLIATQLDSRIAEETSALIEIPIDLDIGIELVTPREEEVAQLYEETGELFTNLDISAIQTIPSNTASLVIDPMAAEAVTACHQGRQDYGIEIQQPPRYAPQNEPTAPQQNHRTGAKKAKKEKKKLRIPDTSIDERCVGMETDIQRLESITRQFLEQIEGVYIIGFEVYIVNIF